MKKKKKILLIIASILLLAIFYFGAFHGEYHSANYVDGKRWTETQYFLWIKLWEKKGSEPEGLPAFPPEKNATLGPAKYWRGFGMIWMKPVSYEVNYR